MIIWILCENHENLVYPIEHMTYIAATNYKIYKYLYIILLCPAIGRKGNAAGRFRL